MMHDPDRLWKSDKAEHLLVIVPGTTGLGFPIKRGFAYIAGIMWVEGISVYLANTEGQDGRHGTIDMSRWASNISIEVESLLMTYGYSQVHFFGTCLGGPVAAKCARVFEAQLFLWETSPVYTSEHREDFVGHCTKGKIPLSEKFWDNLIELKPTVTRNTKVSFFHGSTFQMPFTLQDLSCLHEHFPEWRFIEISGADHGLPRGSNLVLLPSLCSAIKNSILNQND